MVLTQSPRPSRYLAAVSAAYPHAWRQYAKVLDGRQSLGDWPAWCFCPLAAAYAVVTAGGDLPAGPPPPVGAVGALAAWRSTQGIYAYDPTIAQALVDTDLDDTVPVEAFERLPEWAPYLDLGGRLGLAGAWIHLEWDANNRRRELRLVLDRADYEPRGTPADLERLIAIPIHMQAATSIRDGLRRMQSEAVRQALGSGLGVAHQIAQDDLADMASFVAPVISLALYLCAANADVAGDRERLPPTGVRRHKGEPRWDPPVRAPLWRCGFDLGAALRQAGEPQGGTHAGPRPHVRRAHWHTYLVGPRTTHQQRELRWIAPVAVGLSGPPAAPTVRDVT